MFFLMIYVDVVKFALRPNLILTVLIAPTYISRIMDRLLGGCSTLRCSTFHDVVAAAASMSVLMLQCTFWLTLPKKKDVWAL